MTGQWVPYTAVPAELVATYPPCSDWKRLMKERERLTYATENYKFELLRIIRQAVARGAKFPVEVNEAIVTLRLPRIGLLSGEFAVPVWLLDANGVHRFHQVPCEESLLIKNREKQLGLFTADHTWEVEVLEGPPDASARTDVGLEHQS